MLGLLLLALLFASSSSTAQKLPLVVTTWSADGFQQATETAWQSLSSGGGRLFSLVEGLSACERLQCDTTVGYGGSPAEDGTVALDALLMDGPGHRVGSVANLRGVRDAARVAWAIMNYTQHTLLVGEQAKLFALEMGFEARGTETEETDRAINEWQDNKCQPNFRKNVLPDASGSCGPYKPKMLQSDEEDEDDNHASSNRVDRFNHDTIGMVIIDIVGNVSAGTSTNGAKYKVPGRVGDSPIIGSGAYLMDGVGGAAATGDGDVMMRFVPSYQTVEWMRQGVEPAAAAALSLRPILRFYRDFKGAVVAANIRGQYGAACAGIGTFSYSVRTFGSANVEIATVKCL